MLNEYMLQENSEILRQRDWIIAKDNEALSNIRARFAIGHEVSNRLLEWNHLTSNVLHPPIDRNKFSNIGVGDYIFMPGRLHQWKRIDLAIRAIRCSSYNIRLIISGVGDAEESLRQIAGGDPRIVFLGHIDDTSLAGLYAGALAIAFLPIREDYGYVTVEAFASSKPVITCVDSGEPTVFVDDSVSGFVCQPEPFAICAAFETLWNDRELAAKMGRAAHARIVTLDWNIVASKLLEAGFPGKDFHPKTKKIKLKVAILDMQPIMPPIGGGRLRLLGLYHALGAEIQARYVGSYDWPGEEYRKHHITPSLEEIDVPLSVSHHRAAAEGARAAGGKAVINLEFSDQAHLSPKYKEEALAAVDWADTVIFSHPWVFPLIDDNLLKNKLVVYDSHNVEANLQAQLLDINDEYQARLLKGVIQAEREAGDRADLILTCSNEDMLQFNDIYGWNRNKMRLVPNGTFTSTLLPGSLNEKNDCRLKNGISVLSKVAIFFGSDFAPNIEAALYIIECLAKELPQFLFIIGGGVCDRMPPSCPPNVRLVGIVSEPEKLAWLQSADLAVNPMFSGSGTNIKMFDFMSVALPIVTTSVGARGISDKSLPGLHIANGSNMADVIKRLMSDPASAAAGGLQNRLLVQTNYAWETLSPLLGHVLYSAHLRKRGQDIFSSGAACSQIRVAHLSTVGLKCGIGEYTRKKMEIYQQYGIANFLLAARAANEDAVLENLDIPNEIVWFFDNVEWQRSHISERALARLTEWQATHLIIQYHPGFFPVEALYNFVLRAKNIGVIVSVVIHNFQDSAAIKLKHLSKHNIGLFSHSMREVRRAEELGVSLSQIDMAIEASLHCEEKSIKERDWLAAPPVITTTGFLRAHKGVKKLIRAMPLILEQFPGSTLNIRCALYPSDDSKVELESCIELIDSLGIGSSVILETRFLDKEVLLSQLAGADVAVLPYEASDEGGSATAADCMAVGLPLIVSYAEIFNEIRPVTLSTLAEPDCIAKEVTNLLLNAELYSMKSRASVSFAKSNSWDNIAGTFISHASSAPAARRLASELLVHLS